MVRNYDLLVAAARPDGKSTAVVREQLAEWIDVDMDFTSFDRGAGGRHRVVQESWAFWVGWSGLPGSSGPCVL